MAPASTTTHVLPMQLKIRDGLSDETGDYEVIGQPYTTAGGMRANVRVRRVGSEVTMIRVWGTHERVAVKRGNLMAFLSAVVAVVLLLLTAVGCSSARRLPERGGQSRERIAHRSGNAGWKSVERRYATPADPPVPGCSPIVRSTIFTCR